MVDLNSIQSWNDLVSFFNLSDTQKEQFEKYFKLFKTWSDMHNLTAIKEDEKIITNHFEDSLYLSKFLNLKNYKSLCDIGSGGGFPGIPLKILYPGLNLVLVEVNQKKVAFLETVIEELGLENIEVVDVDFRNFLRSYDREIDLFVARASLQVDELLRIFRPSSRFKNADLVYWASKNWEPSELQNEFLEGEFEYKIDDKLRKFYLFSLKNIQ